MHSYAVVLLVIIVVAFCKASTDAAESASTDQPPMSRVLLRPALLHPRTFESLSDNASERRQQFDKIITNNSLTIKTTEWNGQQGQHQVQPFYARDRSGLIATVAREKIGSPSLGDSTKFMASLL